MPAAPALIENQSHSASDFALATVGGGSKDAVNAANAILASFAEEKGLGAQRVAAVNDNMAKDTAALFAVNFDAAGLNFANVAGGDKAPASAPDASGKGSTLSV